MISMSKAYSIRQLRMEGDSIAEISRKLEVSRDTVYKYLEMDDFSPEMPVYGSASATRPGPRSASRRYAAT